jgi:hypothetical protein
MGNARIETGTAILFNAKQLDRQRAASRDGRFCKWLRHVGSVLEDNEEDDGGDDDSDAIVVDGAAGEDDDPIIDRDCDEEFDCIDALGEVDAIADGDLFVEVKVKLDPVDILDEVT